MENKTQDEKKSISSYPMITRKDIIVALNVSEGDLKDLSLIEQLKNKYKVLGIEMMQVSAKVEAEIAKLESEEDIRTVGECIIKITKGSQQVAEKLVKSFDLEKLKSGIESEDDLVKIGFRVWSIALGSEKVAEKLIPAVKNKLKAEENIVKIIECIRLVALGSEKSAEKLIPVVKDKIEAEENIGKICWHIQRLSEGSKETASKLVAQLDPEKAKNPEVRIGIIELKKGGFRGVI